MSLPPIVHAIYRFIEDKQLHNTVELLHELVILYVNMQSLSWQIFAGYFKCTNPVFCAQPYDEGVHKFEASVDKVRFS